MSTTFLDAPDIPRARRVIAKAGRPWSRESRLG
jgi:hypothetical protein